MSKRAPSSSNRCERSSGRGGAGGEAGGLGSMVGDDEKRKECRRGEFGSPSSMPTTDSLPTRTHLPRGRWDAGVGKDVYEKSLRETKMKKGIGFGELLKYVSVLALSLVP